MVKTRSQVKAEAESKALPEDPTSIASITENVATLSLTTNTMDIPIFPGEAPPPVEEQEVFEPVTTVEEFCALIETVPVDQWQKRTAALDSLVATIIASSVEEEEQQRVSAMAPALSQLLKDPRSTVVKRTCAALKNLFQNNNNCSDLLNDMFPTILDIAALTSTVIRSQVQELVVHVMPICLCRPNDVISVLLNRLNDPKVNKSKTVREACVLYMTLAVEHWTTDQNCTAISVDDLLLLQTVGNSLIGAMRDPAPPVREQARKGLQVLRTSHTKVWERLVRDPPSGRDAKVQKLLLQSLEEPTVSLEKLSTSSARRPVNTKGAKTKTGGPPSKFSKFRNFQKQTGADNNNSGSAGSGGVVLVL